MTDETPFISRRARRLATEATPETDPAPRLRDRQGSAFAPEALPVVSGSPPARWAPVRPVVEELPADTDDDAPVVVEPEPYGADEPVEAESLDDDDDDDDDDDTPPVEEKSLSRKERRAIEAKNKPRPWWRTPLEFAAIVVIAALVVVLIKAVAFRAFEVPSESMNPTLITNDHIIAEMISPHFDEYKRGDVVVFKDPDDWLGNGNDGNGDPNFFQLMGLAPEDTGYLVKRVLAVPGETIQGLEDGTILINGEELTGDFGPHLPQNTFIQTLSEGEYWMMGDNRGASADSRMHGPVNVDNFVGRVAFRFLPFDRFGALD